MLAFRITPELGGKFQFLNAYGYLNCRWQWLPGHSRQPYSNPLPCLFLFTQKCFGEVRKSGKPPLAPFSNRREGRHSSFCKTKSSQMCFFSLLHSSAQETQLVSRRALAAHVCKEKSQAKHGSDTDTAVQRSNGGHQEHAVGFKLPVETLKWNIPRGKHKTVLNTIVLLQTGIQTAI